MLNFSLLLVKRNKLVWWILCLSVGDNTVGVETAEREGLTALTWSYGRISILGLRDNTLLLASWVAWCWLVWDFMPASISGTWSHRWGRDRLGCRGPWMTPNKCLLQQSSPHSLAFSAHTNRLEGSPKGARTICRPEFRAHLFHDTHEAPVPGCSRNNCFPFCSSNLVIQHYTLPQTWMRAKV